MDLVLWYFGLWVLSEPNPNLNGYPIEPERFKISKKEFVPNMTRFLIYIQNTLIYYWTSKILSITWRLMVKGGGLKLEVFRFWFCFHWIMFLIHENFVFILCFHLFDFISSNNYVYLSFDFEWSCLMFYSYFWIDFTYVLVTK